MQAVRRAHLCERDPNVTRGVSYARSMPLNTPEPRETTAPATGSGVMVGDDEDQASFLGSGEEISRPGTLLSEGSVDAELNESTSEQVGPGVRYGTRGGGEGNHIQNHTAVPGLMSAAKAVDRIVLDWHQSSHVNMALPVTLG